MFTVYLKCIVVRCFDYIFVNIKFSYNFEEHVSKIEKNLRGRYSRHINALFIIGKWLKLFPKIIICNVQNINNFL